jgi:transposase
MVSHYDPEAEPTFWRIPDDLWEECRPLLPPEKSVGTPGRPNVPLRRVLDGILYVLRTGCQWKAVPRAFGSGSTCHRRFQQWAADGTWERLWREQLDWYDTEHGIGWDWQAADSATVPSPPRRGGHGPGSDQPRQAGHQTACPDRSARGARGRGGERRQRPRPEAGGGHVGQRRSAPARAHAGAAAAPVSGQGIRLSRDASGGRGPRLSGAYRPAGPGASRPRRWAAPPSTSLGRGTHEQLA